MYWIFAFSSHLGEIINSRPQIFGNIYKRGAEIRRGLEKFSEISNRCGGPLFSTFEYHQRLFSLSTSQKLKVESFMGRKSYDLGAYSRPLLALKKHGQQVLPFSLGSHTKHCLLCLCF